MAHEYRRVMAKPALIAAIGLGTSPLARRQLETRGKPGLLGKVEPRKLRRRNARTRPRARLCSR
jgi:hypothetical protein